MGMGQSHALLVGQCVIDRLRLQFVRNQLAHNLNSYINGFSIARPAGVVRSSASVSETNATPRCSSSWSVACRTVFTPYPNPGVAEPCGSRPGGHLPGLARPRITKSARDSAYFCEGCSFFTRKR